MPTPIIYNGDLIGYSDVVNGTPISQVFLSGGIMTGELYLVTTQAQGDNLIEAINESIELIDWDRVNKTGSNLTEIETRLHNDLQGLQGGQPGEYYHLKKSEAEEVATLSITYLKLDGSNGPMTGDLPMGGNSITDVGSVGFDTAYSKTGNETTGMIYWDDQYKTWSAVSNIADVIGQLFEEQWIDYVNKTGVTITNGQVLYLSGATGAQKELSPAIATNQAQAHGVLAVATADCLNNAQSKATVSGTVRDLDTSAWSVGDELFLSHTVAGQLTTTQPPKGNHTVYVAKVIRSHVTQGEIEVSIRIIPEIEELDDVSITTPTEGDILQYSASNLWENVPFLPAILDTEVNILAMTPTAGKFMASSDTKQLFVGDGTNWLNLSIEMDARRTDTYVGARRVESHIGYGRYVIVKKQIVHSSIGINSYPEDGGLQYVDGSFQGYTDGEWGEFVRNIRLRQNSSENVILEYSPEGLEDWYGVHNGNSDRIGNNGLPLVQGYSAVVGSRGVKTLISGGTIYGN